MTPPFPELDALCAAMEEYGASDLILHEGRSPKMRLNARLIDLAYPPLSSEFFRLLWETCGAAPTITDYDGSLTAAGNIRFRINLLQQLGDRAAVLRRIRGTAPDLGTLGLPAELLQTWCSRDAGIVLVCGPTGSGKSTTLAAALQWVNLNFSRHIVTIEDPVEYLFANKQSTFTQREVGIDTPTFAEGLRRALRQAPDVVLVGEIRDPATAVTAIQASETGHLVLATLHSSTCVDAIERIQLLFPQEERDSIRKTLAAQLIGIICQRLIPLSSGGAIVATEYFTNMGASRKYIGEGQLSELSDFVHRSDSPGVCSFLTALVGLVRGGKISEHEAISVTDQPQELQRALRGISSSVKSARI